MESPFSWNVRYTSALGGFPCQLTVRSETSDVLLEKIGNVEKWLVASGATPAGPETPAAIAAPVVALSKQAEEHPAGWCGIHSTQMAIHEKNGTSWYSHQVDEGWCRGGKKNGNGNGR